MDNPTVTDNTPVTPTPSTPTRKNKKPILLLGLALVVVLILAGGFLWKQSKPQSQLTTNNLSSTTATPGVTSSTTPSTSQTTPTNSNNIPIDIKVNVESTASGKISGTLTFTNKSDQAYTDLYYDLSLNTPDYSRSIQTSKGKTITISTGSNVILNYDEKDLANIAGKGTKTVPFEINYSSHLPAAKYRFIATVASKPSNLLGRNAGTFLDLSGDGNFLRVNLDPTKCYDGVGDNKGVAAFAAPISNANSKVVAICEVTNPTKNQITARYHYDYSIMNVLGYPVADKLQQTSNQTVTFNPGETKTLTIPLPDVTTPQVYETLISLVDQSGNELSSTMDFRWTVGGASANITGLQPDKDYYSKGDNAKITVDDSPSMDLFWREASGSGTQIGTVLDNARLVVSVSNGSNQLCGQQNQNLPRATNVTDWSSQDITVAINRDCLDPQIQAQIFNGNTKLAELTKHIITSSATRSQIPTTSPSTSAVKYILAVIILILVITVAYLLIKKRKPPIVLLIAILFVATFYFPLYLPKRVNAINYIPEPGSGLYSQSGKTNCSENTSDPVSATVTNADTTMSGNQETVSVSVSASGPSKGYWCNNNHPFVHIYMTTPNEGQFDVQQLTYGENFGPNVNNGNPITVTNGYGTYTTNGSQASGSSWSNQDDTITVSNNQYLDVYFEPELATIHGSCDNNGNPVGSNGSTLCYLGQVEAVSSNQYNHDSSRGYCYPEAGDYHWVIPNPPAPTNTSAQSSCNNGLPQNTITWTEPTSGSTASYYKVVRSDGGTNGVTTTSTSYTDQNNGNNTNQVARNQSYSYSIVACDANNHCSLAGNTASTTTGWCDGTAPKTTISAFPPPGQTCMTSTDLQNNLAQVTSTDYGDGTGGTNPSGLAQVQANLYDVTSGSLVDRNSPLDTSPKNITGDTNTAFLSIPYSKMQTGHVYQIIAFAKDQAGNSNLTTAPVSAKFDFDQSKCVEPFLKTNNGDVHSNGTINTPGGPQ